MQFGFDFIGMCRPALALVACVATVGSVAPALANDSVANLAAGGVVLSRTDQIEMQEEDLFVSSREVRVRYQFVNRTGKPVTTLVAFPLPQIRTPSDADNFIIPEPDDTRNFMGFATTVDGKPVEMEMEQRALATGVDRTDMLLRLSLPIAPQDPALPGLLARLPERTRRQLREIGMIDDSALESGLPIGLAVRPLWVANTTFYWKQVFPAKGEVVVEHRYRPSVGGAAQTSIGEDYQSAENKADYERRYCIDDRFVQAVKRMRRAGGGPSRVMITESWLEYVLTTGTNWAGSIAKFTLTVDKGEPGNLVSFCMDGARKISPTQFQVTKEHFWPQRELEILILKPFPLK